MQDSYPDYIGEEVTLADGGRGRIWAICITGEAHRIEYQIVWWYHGERREAWMERGEFSVVNSPVPDPC